MTLLALATFLDGVYVDWRFCIVGAVVGCGVMLVAVVDDAALSLVLVGLVAVAALYLFAPPPLPRRRRHVSCARAAAHSPLAANVLPHAAPSRSATIPRVPNHVLHRPG